MVSAVDNTSGQAVFVLRLEGLLQDAHAIVLLMKKLMIVCKTPM